jgi:hypothetical protein
MKHKKKTKANKASLYEMMRARLQEKDQAEKAKGPSAPPSLGKKRGVLQKMKKGGKLYEKGGVNDPTRKAERRKALLNELRIANDPKTNYGSEKARAKDVATIQAKIKALG